ncbi:hypothetical protein R6Q59_000554 [Mikania micrantha]
MGNGLLGLDCLEGNGESLINSGDSGKCGGGDSGSVPESMVLETCSSFGSINSSASASNLVPIGVNNEDGGGNLMEKKVKVAATGSIESDNPARVYQDKVLLEPESIIYNPLLPVQIPYVPEQNSSRCNIFTLHHHITSNTQQEHRYLFHLTTRCMYHISNHRHISITLYTFSLWSPQTIQPTSLLQLML